MIPRRRTLYTALVLSTVFLVGAVIVLTSVHEWMAISPRAFINLDEVPVTGRNLHLTRNATGEEKVPRILHQTYKTEKLPEAWESTSNACKAMMPDYEYMFWTDASSRAFIKEHYPWFLDTFDGYKYNIQRADSVRYFILHYYGGAYLDLDVNCLLPIDHLLKFDVVLPRTRPVGISNDVMLAEKGHPFFAQTIHNLVTFDHSWILNYPTVIFTTGPMFLSVQYGLYTSSHPESEVRVLPTSMYGKYSKGDEGTNAFFHFDHKVGGSWHGSDATFVAFLHQHGMKVLYVAILIVILGALRMASTKKCTTATRGRTIGGYEVILPRWSTNNKNGRMHVDLGWLSIPTTTEPSSPTTTESEYGDSRPPSPVQNQTARRRGTGVLPWIRRNVFDVVGPSGERERGRPGATRRANSRGVMYFMPAIFTEPSSFSRGRTGTGAGDKTHPYRDTQSN